VVHDVDRVAACVGHHDSPAVEEHVDRVGVDRWIADRRIRIHVALERPEVGDLPDLPVVLDPQQSAEEIRDRVLPGQGVLRHSTFEVERVNPWPIHLRSAL
jgi:hypothetical protein